MFAFQQFNAVIESNVIQMNYCYKSMNCLNIFAQVIYFRGTQPVILNHLINFLIIYCLLNKIY